MPVTKHAVCKGCGNQFSYSNAKSYKRYTCSKVCAAKVGAEAATKARQAAKAIRAATVIPCVICEAPFKPSERKNGNKTTCSRSCTLTLNNPTRNGPMTKVKPCKVCGRFTAKGMFCGDACKTKNADAVKERARQKRRDTRTERRNMERHEYHQSGRVIDRNINAKVLAEAHDYTCMLCGEEVERHLGKDWQPRGWSVGHIVPVRYGGDTSHANCWTECMECNSAKSENTLPPWTFRGMDKIQKYTYMADHFDLFKD